MTIEGYKKTEMNWKYAHKINLARFGLILHRLEIITFSK